MAYLLATESMNWVYAALVVVLIQWPLSIFALMRLYKSPIKGAKSVLLHIYIVAVFIVGPISFIIYDMISRRSGFLEFAPERSDDDDDDDEETDG